ncbi:MAG: winged helix-turn-helix transcriptional regulator [Halobacteriaceae archaeon]
MAPTDDGLDDLDRAILAALLDDGRTSVTAVAAAVDATAATVSDRLDALVERGVLAGVEPSLDYAALGYDLVVVFFLSVRADAREALLDRLRENDRLVIVYEVTGAHDVVAVGRFRSGESLDDRAADVLLSPAVERLSAGVTPVGDPALGPRPVPADADAGDRVTFPADDPSADS